MIVASANPAPVVPAIEALRSVPWAMETHIDGERVADIIERCR